MDGWTERRTDERKSPCVLQDFVPFGAAAQKGSCSIFDKNSAIKTDRQIDINSDSQTNGQTNIFRWMSYFSINVAERIRHVVPINVTHVRARYPLDGAPAHPDLKTK